MAVIRRVGSALWGLWLAFGRVMSRVVTFLLLTILYFTVFALTALFLRLTGADPLGARGKSQVSYWLQREPVPTDWESHLEPF
jgi:hypothetical protein